MSSLNQQQQRNLSHSSAALTEKDLETKAADPDNLVYTYTYDKTIPINSATENYHLALLTKKLYNNIKLENPGWCDKKMSIYAEDLYFLAVKYQMAELLACSLLSCIRAISSATFMQSFESAQRIGFVVYFLL